MSVFSRHALAAPARSAMAIINGMEASARHLMFDGPKPLRVVLVSDELVYTSEQQFAPMKRYAAALRREFGVVVEHLSLRRGLTLSRKQLGSVDLLGFKLSFMTPSAEASRIARQFRDRIAGTPAKLIYFDGDDDLCVQWPDLLTEVDCYIKKHAFTDVLAYNQVYVGKSNLTDHVARVHGRSFDDNAIRSSGPVPVSDVAKLHVGWNIGLDDKIADLVQALPPVGAQPKDVDVGSRAFVNEDVWIYPLRGPLVERIGAMEDRFRVLAPRERVSQQQYYAEMLRARICVSPFGYGEICWRDFEAVLCGCMLGKPDMGHVRTYPDIFVAGETYAPVKWDYADLGEVCAKYLEDEPARQRIADRAHAVLIEALGEPAFVHTFGSLLEQLGLRAGAIRSSNGATR